MVMGALTPLSPPRTLGDMTLLAKLGEGGMAKVFFAAVGQGALARPAAVKLLRADLPDHDYRTRFLDEARVVVRLHHNNLVDVRAAGEQDDQLFIVMEAIEGRDLADIWDRCAERGRAFPLPLAVYIVREVLRGLHYAHTFPGLSLVHRDVSPSNVLVDWAGAVRLADFGLATSTLKHALTVPGVVFGKVGYMSPEQALREELDGRADVYACAVMLWELITGRTLRDPREHDTDDVAAFEARAPSLHSRRVDEQLDAIVVKGLARKREDRWESADAMMRALNAWLGKHAPGTSQETMADFMNEMFAGAKAEEVAQREAMLQRVEGDPAASRSMTIAYGRTPTDQIEQAANQSMAAGSFEAPVPHVEVEAIAAGTVIAERYRVLSRLGRGGMGTVYLGEHLTVGRNVAIKVLTHEWSRHEGVAQRFRAEARAASAAGHPNIVEVFDAGELPDGRLFLVMEFLTGRTLWEELEAVGPMPVPRACRIMRDVARAVKAAHEVGIVHRDLKPDNIMIADRDGEFIKVLDFGISASAERPEDERLTVAGQTLGTPEYMAPEQALGREVTPLFDIYALGAIFFELLVGEPPMSGPNVVEVMTRKTTQPAPSVGSSREGLPSKLVRLIDDCLSISPERRPSSVRLFLSRLEEALRQLPRDTPGPEAGAVAPVSAAPLSGPSGRPAWLFPVLGAGVVAAVVAAVVWATNPGAGDPQEAQAAAESAAAAGAATSGSESSESSGDVDATDEDDARDLAPAGTASGDSDVEPGATGATGSADLPAASGATGLPAASGATGQEGASTGEEGGAAASTASASAPAYQSAACRRTRKQAEDSARGGAWSDVLKRTRKRECWARRAERQALEVRAYKELQRFAECARVGKGHPDPAIRRIVTLCEKRAAKP